MGLNVVLVEPEIPWNTGNIGRTCVAAGAALHLVGRLGFSLSGREIRRSGLDYWPRLKVRLHADFAAFEASLPPGARLILFDPRGKKSLWRTRMGPECYLVFGSESRGFSPEIIRRHGQRLCRIPMEGQSRSLNLSTSAGIALYEALRRIGP